MSPEFIRRVRRYQPSTDPDTATLETIAVMVDLIDRSAADPLLVRCAETAIAQGRPLWAIRRLNPATAGRIAGARLVAEADWFYAKHQLRFVHHSKQIDVWLGERDQLQLLIEPSVLVRFPFRMEGDCAIYTMLLCAMLQAQGLDYELVTAAVNPEQPTIFSHVWPRVILPDGSRMALDASHGKYPGWSVPIEHRSRVQVWDRSGQPTDDRGDGGRFGGLHGYRLRRGLGRYRRGLGDDSTDYAPIVEEAPIDTGIVSAPGTSLGPSLAPFGTPGSAVGVDSEGNTIFASGTSLDQLGTVATDPSTGLQTVTTPAASGQPSQTGYVAPAGNSSTNAAQWASFANQLAKSGLTLAEIQSMAPGTVVLPNGTILRQAAGYPVSTSGLNTLGTALSSVSPNVLMIAGLAIAAVFAFSAFSKR